MTVRTSVEIYGTETGSMRSLVSQKRPTCSALGEALDALRVKIDFIAHASRHVMRSVHSAGWWWLKQR
jgi:uncharacterized protein YktB (UPF0637 family)